MSKMQFSAPHFLSKHAFSSEFVSYDLRERDALLLSNPVVSFTHFFMSAPFFPPHPHAGFSAITYIFEHSRNSFLNRDSLGNEGPIHPGELHWTLAGRGVMHEEKPITNGVIAEGLQIFVNMKQKNKKIPPAAFHVNNENAPRYLDHGLTIKLLSGAHAGRSAEFALPEPTQILDISLESAGTLDVGTNQGGLIYVFDGELEVQVKSDWQKVSKQSAISFRSSESESNISLKSSLGAKLIAIYGTPTDEPVVAKGPFIMTTIEDVLEAEKRYHLGEMGRL